MERVILIKRCKVINWVNFMEKVDDMATKLKPQERNSISSNSSTKQCYGVRLY